MEELAILATIAQILFVAATLMQALKVAKEGHADGISHGLIFMLTLGFFIMMWYTIEVLNSDPVLLGGYIGQGLLFLIIGKYKYFPRRNKK